MGMQADTLLFKPNSTFIRLSKLFDFFDSLCIKLNIYTLARLFSCLMQLNGTQSIKTNDMQMTKGRDKPMLPYCQHAESNAASSKDDSGKKAPMKNTAENMRLVHRR